MSNDTLTLVRAAITGDIETLATYRGDLTASGGTGPAVEAVVKEALDKIERFPAYLTPKDLVGRGGQSLLHWACWARQYDTAVWLVDQAQELLTQRNGDGETAFYAACEGGNPDMADWLLKKDPTLLYLNRNDGRTVFHCVCYGGHLNMADWLLQKDPKLLYQKTQRSWTAFHSVCQGGNRDMADWLLQKDSKLLYENMSDSGTCFHAACLGGNPAIADWLLRKDPKLLHRKTKDGLTAFHAACQGGHPTMADWLLQKDPELLHRKTQRGWTAFHSACAGGYPAMADWLLERDPKLLYQNANNGRTAFHVVCHGDNPDMADWLLKKDPTLLHQKTEGDETALHVACVGGYLVMVRYLVEEKGVETAAKTKAGETAYQIAKQEKHTDCVDYLRNHGLREACRSGNIAEARRWLKAGATLTTIDNSGNGLITLACRGGSLKMVKWLIDRGAPWLNLDLAEGYGHTQLATYVRLLKACQQGNLEYVQQSLQADPDTLSDNGPSLLQAACRGGHLPVVQYLVEAGVSFKQKDSNGQTPLAVAKARGHQAVVDYLKPLKQATFSKAHRERLMQATQSAGRWLIRGRFAASTPVLAIQKTASASTTASSDKSVAKAKVASQSRQASLSLSETQLNERVTTRLTELEHAFTRHRDSLEMRSQTLAAGQAGMEALMLQADPDAKTVISPDAAIPTLSTPTAEQSSTHDKTNETWCGSINSSVSANKHFGSGEIVQHYYDLLFVVLSIVGEVAPLLSHQDTAVSARERLQKLVFERTQGYAHPEFHAQVTASLWAAINALFNGESLIDQLGALGPLSTPQCARFLAERYTNAFVAELPSDVTDWDSTSPLFRLVLMEALLEIISETTIQALHEVVTTEPEAVIRALNDTLFFTQTELPSPNSDLRFFKAAAPAGITLVDLPQKIANIQSQIESMVENEWRARQMLCIRQQARLSLTDSTRARDETPPCLQQALQCYYRTVLCHLLELYEASSSFVVIQGFQADVTTSPENRSIRRDALKVALIGFAAALIPFTMGASTPVVLAAATAGVGGATKETWAERTAGRFFARGRKKDSLANEYTRLFNQMGGVDCERAKNAIKEIAFQLTLNRVKDITSWSEGVKASMDAADELIIIGHALSPESSLEGTIKTYAETDVRVMMQPVATGQYQLLNPEQDYLRCQIAERALTHLAKCKAYTQFRFIERSSNQQGFFEANGGAHRSAATNGGNPARFILESEDESTRKHSTPCQLM